jgi:beta-phosphoglucomutase-like phosphatase (HAD superfamily)
MPPITIIFDFDKVLADSEPLHFHTLQMIITKLGITIEHDEYYEQYLEYDDVGTMKLLSATHNQSWTDQQINALIEHKSIIFKEIPNPKHLFEDNQLTLDERTDLLIGPGLTMHRGE